MSNVTISGRTLGSRRPLFADWSVPLPPEWRGEGGMTLRDLIASIVRHEVHAFRERQEARKFIRALTVREMAEGAAKGKIDSGGSQTGIQEVDEDSAVATACQAFEDGLYLVVIDGQDFREIDREVHLQADSRITFIRLAMLAGG
jgi:hypothetical protein